MYTRSARRLEDGRPSAAGPTAAGHGAARHGATGTAQQDTAQQDTAQQDTAQQDTAQQDTAEQDKVMQLHSMYQEIILDHYRHPHHKGLREPYDAEVHHVNPVCGDEVTVRVRLAGAGEAARTTAAGGDAADVAAGTLNGADGEARVADVSYDALGCSISQASASVMTDLVIGKTVKEALAVGDEFLALMQSRGEVEPDEDTLEDAVAFAGVAKYPARIKCALLGWMAWKDATARAMNGKAGQAS